MNKSTIWLVIGVALISSFCQGDKANKRLPLGFQGMRGRKNVDFPSLDDSYQSQMELDDLSYPSIPYFDDLIRYARIPDSWITANNYYGQRNIPSTLKRAPMGFLGMRGKKDNIMTAPPYTYAINDNSAIDEYEKRGLKGFQGMRGKKQYEYLKNYFNKRKSLGFLGMRGKKLSDYPLGSFNDLEKYLQENGSASDNYSNENSVKNAAFDGARDKREFDYLNSIEEFKRAPSGFQGMRGKKDVSAELHTEIEAPKETGVNQNQINGNALGMQEVVSDDIAPPSNGQIFPFEAFGLNREMSNNLGNFVSAKERRSPNYGFYGVRGKKQPSFSTFYGMRGKKVPYGFPFRGKFVGVRGKKSDNLQHLAERLSWTDDEGFQKRRGPSGFFGMRGKKTITPGDEIDLIEDGNK